MRLDRLNSWLTLVANIGVIAGIVFLGLEIQQNTAALQANSREAALDNAMSSLFLAINDPTLILNRVKPELTEQERVKLSQYLSSLVQRGVTIRAQSQTGALDEQSWIDFKTTLTGILSYPQTRKWWEFTRASFPVDFANELTGMLEKRAVQTELWDVQAFD